jgi:hypothetical protein
MSVFDSVRYIYDELSENYGNSWWWRKRIAARLLKPIHARFRGFDDAVTVMEEDWDTLVVLDACRADLFEKVVGTDRFDSYKRVTSLGSATAEWTTRNFDGSTSGDTVYVASNPHTSQIAGDTFHELVEVWRDMFDEEHHTVMPGPVTKAALDAHERHPQKRLICHYMQPHRPFVQAEGLQFAGWHPKWHYGSKDVDGVRHPFHALEQGIVSHGDVWEAYADNLKFVISDVIELLQELDGRTVITSDHGNLMGERSFPIPVRMYAHPRGVREPELIEVPWAVIEGTERRQVTDEGVNVVEEFDKDRLYERLADLGYN